MNRVTQKYEHFGCCPTLVEVWGRALRCNSSPPQGISLDDSFGFFVCFYWGCGVSATIPNAGFGGSMSIVLNYR
jgi:hypothetical protein